MLIPGFQNVLMKAADYGKVGSCNNRGAARPLKPGGSRVAGDRQSSSRQHSGSRRLVLKPLLVLTSYITNDGIPKLKLLEANLFFFEILKKALEFANCVYKYCKVPLIRPPPPTT